MNSLKTLFVLAVLAAVAYGVHLSINRDPDKKKDLAEAPPWNAKPQTPGAAAATPNYAADPSAYPGDSSGTGTIPPLSSSGATIPLSGNTAGDSARRFTLFKRAIQAKLDEGRLAEAHLELSQRFDDPSLSPPQAGQVKDLLDKLAGTVIYSQEYLLEPPRPVRSGETLPQIAEEYGVPWQVLARINRIRDPNRLPPQQQLKVVRGPFDARVYLARGELVLMLNGRYAGTFPIGIGDDYPNLTGSYQVSSKNPAAVDYRGPDGTVIAAGDPKNPLGKLGLALATPQGQPTPLSIHGTNDPLSLHSPGGRGSIRLVEKDIEDVCGILSVGSRVEILR